VYVLRPCGPKKKHDLQAAGWIALALVVFATLKPDRAAAPAPSVRAAEAFWHLVLQGLGGLGQLDRVCWRCCLILVTICRAGVAVLGIPTRDATEYPF